MSSHNTGFYEEISKIIPYHQIHTLSLLYISFQAKLMIRGQLFEINDAVS